MAKYSTTTFLFMILICCLCLLLSVFYVKLCSSPVYFISSFILSYQSRRVGLDILMVMNSFWGHESFLGSLDVPFNTYLVKRNEKN